MKIKFHFKGAIMFKKKLALLALPLITTLSLTAASPFDDPFFKDPFGDDIFKEMLQMQKEMDKMFERMQQRRLQRSSGLVSPLGTYRMAVQGQFIDKGDRYNLVTGIPESKENHIDIRTENGMMSVTAKIIKSEEQKQNGMVSRSSSVRMYQQSVPMPLDADENSITTAYEKGRLVISVGKKKGVRKANTASVNGKVQPINTTHTAKVPAKTETSKPEAAKHKAEKRVEITKEFDQTPVTAKKEEVKSDSKETQGTIKKEHISSDKASMI